MKLALGIGWMASLTRWTWVSVNFRSWWWTGRHGVLRFMGSQRVRHDWVTDLIWSLIFLKRSLVFRILLFSSISLHWSLRKVFLYFLLFFGTLHSNGYIFPFLLCLSFLFSQLFVRPPQTTILPFCISFSWGWCWFLSRVQCHKPASVVLQVLCLSDLISWIYSIIIRDLI